MVTGVIGFALCSRNDGGPKYRAPHQERGDGATLGTRALHGGKQGATGGSRQIPYCRLRPLYFVSLFPQYRERSVSA